jgi:hypothetical protein
MSHPITTDDQAKALDIDYHGPRSVIVFVTRWMFQRNFTEVLGAQYA